MWAAGVLFAALGQPANTTAAERLTANAATDQVAHDLAAAFSDPPPAARPHAYWCWLNGNVSPDHFAHELQEFKDKGLSGVYIFDVGARDPDGVIPAGPPFMGPESIRAIVRAVREATRAGIDVGLITSSSWNAGGSWVKPEHAAMGLYQSEIVVEGPRRLSEVLPFPGVPKKCPKRPDGRPVFYTDVAVLAMPQLERLPGHEFLFEVTPPGEHTVDHVVLYNAPSENPDRYGKRNACPYSIPHVATVHPHADRDPAAYTHPHPHSHTHRNPQSHTDHHPHPPRDAELSLEARRLDRLCPQRDARL